MKRFRSALVVALALVVTGAMLAAQTARPAADALAAFGASEATVRTQILESVSGGGEISGRLLVQIQEGYQRIPVAMRAAATTAAFAWARGYISSPAFATAYARFREERRPAGAVSTGTVDEEVQKEIAATIAQLEASKKALESLDPALRAKVINELDQQIARYKSPDTARQLRIGVEAQRQARNQDNAEANAEFADKWPSDPQVYVRRQLMRFMTATADIDYSLPQIWVKDPAGKTVGFLSAGLEEISWETLHALLAGREAVAAARDSVSAWLKELP